MAVALRPADFDFDFGAESPDGSAWEPFPGAEPTYPAAGEFVTNPKHLLDAGDLERVTLWSIYRSGHQLPDAGGSLDQAAIMIDSFGVMEDAASRLRKP